MEAGDAHNNAVLTAVSLVAVFYGPYHMCTSTKLVVPQREGFRSPLQIPPSDENAADADQQEV